MSILLIGEHSRGGAFGDPPWQLNQIRKQKTYHQEQYHRELLQQIKDNQARRKKQHELDRLHDQILNKAWQQPLKSPQRPDRNSFAYKSPFPSIQTSPKRSALGEYPLKDYVIGELKQKNKQNDDNRLSPKGWTSVNSKGGYSRQRIMFPRFNMGRKLNEQNEEDNEFLLQQSRARPNYRVKTEFDDAAFRLDQSVQTRQKLLRQKLDMKIREVYDAMTNSIKCLNVFEDLKHIHLKMSRHKVNEEKQARPINQFWALPYRKVSDKKTLQFSPEDESVWDEWYLKKKLIELESIER